MATAQRIATHAAKTRAGHSCLARVELCISPRHQSGEQGKKHQKNAGGKNNSPQVWNVPGDPCPKDRPAAERQQDVQESDDDNLNILRDRHWRVDLSWPVQYAPIRVYPTTSGHKEASCPQSQACATPTGGTFCALSGHAFHGFRPTSFESNHSPCPVIRSARPTLAVSCHVWTAPSWQGESSRRVTGRCSHVFGLFGRFT